MTETNDLQQLATRRVNGVDTLNLRAAADRITLRRLPRKDDVIPLYLPADQVAAWLRGVAIMAERAYGGEYLPGLVLADVIAQLPLAELVARRTDPGHPYNQQEETDGGT